MYEVKSKTLEWAHKPFDVVTDKGGSVGFIEEVSVNICQSSPESQIKYSVSWMTGKTTKHAWFDHDELTVHCNIFVKLAENMCNGHGNNSKFVRTLLGSMKD